MEGWIGDHPVDFLVDSGICGSQSNPDAFCVVSFLGLRTEFPILVCDLSTDAIIGTYILGSILPRTLDIKHGLLFTEGGVSLQLHCRDAALSGRVFTVGHCSIPPYSEAVIHCTTRTVGGRSMPPSGLLEGLTVFSENTDLVVGRTLVDPSGWKVPVLVSNFGQETIMVEPFSDIGMIAQVTVIQPVMNQPSRSSCDPSVLPEYLRGLLGRASHDLDDLQRGQLAETLLEFVDLLLCRDLLWQATPMLWNMPSTLETVYRFAVLRGGCHRRRLNKKRLVSKKC